MMKNYRLSDENKKMEIKNRCKSTTVFILIENQLFFLSTCYCVS